MLHEKRLMHMVVLMCLTVAASFAWETWPAEYDMIAHGGEFFAIAVSALAGSRCAFDTSCNDCAAFVSVQQIFYVAFIVYTLVRVQVAQLLCYCVLYVSSTTVVYGIVEDAVCPAVTTTQTSLTRTSTTSTRRRSRTQPQVVDVELNRVVHDDLDEPPVDEAIETVSVDDAPPENASETVVVESCNKEDAGALDCVICMDPLHAKELRALPCAHVYHDECILQWIRLFPRCPVCNYDLLA